MVTVSILADISVDSVSLFVLFLMNKKQNSIHFRFTKRNGIQLDAVCVRSSRHFIGDYSYT